MSGKENSGSWDVEGDRTWLWIGGRLGLEALPGMEERERKWPTGRRAEAADEGRWGSWSPKVVHGATRMKLELVLEGDTDG